VSDRDQRDLDPYLDDPFRLDDPAARERAVRRLEREQRRRERADRQRSGGRRLALGRRVKGARAEDDGRPGIDEPVPPNPQPAPPPELPPQPQAAPRPAGRGAPPPASVVRRRRILGLVGIAAAGVLTWFLVALFQPFAGDGEGEVVVTIPKGASAGDTADILDGKGVVSSGMMFEIRLTLAGKGDDIQAGTYTLASGMSYSAAMNELTQPPSQRTVTVVVPEGYGREQIVELASEAGLSGDYEKASRRSNLLNPGKYGAQRTDGLEGFLFPATYELEPGSSAQDLVEQQVEAFRRSIKEVDMSYARSENLTVYDVLTIASMIDREVQVPEERELVSAVIYNRLERGEPLGIDATIRYATDNYTKPLRESELATDSPYNTRLVAGLPPTPIGNPGLDAIEAAAKPAKVDYRFYVVKPGTCGEHFFTATEAEFEQAAQRYQKALEREGGSPTEC
jgi:uncharacterized YceG family protein